MGVAASMVAPVGLDMCSGPRWQSMCTGHLQGRFNAARSPQHPTLIAPVPRRCAWSAASRASSFPMRWMSRCAPSWRELPG